jgi:hypothetical protein
MQSKRRKNRGRWSREEEIIGRRSRRRKVIEDEGADR